jgi:hypothetical protein
LIYTPVFDEAKHSYCTPEGQPLDGTTTIIRSCGFMPEVAGLDPKYATRGTNVHKITEDYDRGILNESIVPVELRGYLESWKLYRREHGINYDPNAIERKLYDPTYLYAGTLDRPDCDIKSGTPAPWHILQLAAYSNLTRQSGLYTGTLNKCVYLKMSGEYPTIKPYTIKQLIDAEATFKCCLNVYRTKKEMKII